MKIAIAMSGGIDSSAAVLKLLEENHQCEGFTLSLFNDSSNENFENSNAITNAREIAKKIGIKHHIIDLRKEFKKNIIDYFINSYLKGLTPNPCIFCNPAIKFGSLLEEITSRGFEKLATGHYANIVNSDYGFVLKKGNDNVKDQSYFLSRIKKDLFPYLLFPLGNMTKPEVRDYMNSKGLFFSDKESQEICFIPDNDYVNFIRKNSGPVAAGNFTSESGKVIGKHNGIPFYTIGQRRGIGVSLGKPGYVRKINVEDNTIEIGDKICIDEFYITDLNALIPELLEKKLDVKVRYRSNGEKCSLKIHSESEWVVKTERNISSVTPGQAAVFYYEDMVVGCGIIKKY